MLSLIYPRRCMHCKGSLARGNQRLCAPCGEQLDFYSSIGRCSQCYVEIYQPQGSCAACRRRWAPMRKVAACFDSFGPAGSILKAFKEGCRRDLARDIAAFMVVQLERQAWFVPDFLISVPIPKWKKMWRGFNQSLQIAEEMGKMLQIPVIDPLIRKMGRFSSELLEKEERVSIKKEDFAWKKKAPDVETRVILLIDDLLVTGATLRAAAICLLDKEPRAIYGLTFCGER